MQFLRYLRPMAGVGAFLLLLVSLSAQADSYRKHEIAQARFGANEMAKYLDIATHLKEKLDQEIFGQGNVTESLQSVVTQYLETFGTRTGAPLSRHFMGLPGVGKSAMIMRLKELGLPIVVIDMQQFANETGSTSLVWRVRDAKESFGDGPGIILFDELDKIPEIADKNEVTRPAIGAMNQLLNEGRISGLNQDLSNCLMITTSNFSHELMDGFIKQALGVEKRSYELTIDEFRAFHDWLMSNSSSRYLVLSQLFRSNTVSRIAPNLIFFEPLSLEAYRQIARQALDAEIATATEKQHAQKRIVVEYSETFLDFALTRSTVPASGARETVLHLPQMIGQLIHFGLRGTHADDQSLDRPRRISIDYDPARDVVEVEVTPRIYRERRLEDGTPFTIETKYSPLSRSFSVPENLALTPPESIQKKRKEGEAESDEKPPTIGQIRKARFGSTSGRKAKGLADAIDEKILGQGVFGKMLEGEMNSYLGRSGPSMREPSYSVLAGFPGDGKSQMAKITAENLNLPVARVNLQGFASNSEGAVEQFLKILAAEVARARAEAQAKSGGKFLVLFEELDKIYEMTPDGPVDRPVMAVIKDLLSEGYVRYTKDREEEVVELDIRDAYSMVTMNFSVELFDFKADPRLTSIEDKARAIHSLRSKPADLRDVLIRLFLPETVSRLLPRFFIVDAPKEHHYRKIIQNVAAEVEAERLSTSSGENQSLVNLRLTSAYRKYLFQETVIPSEGARYTVNASRNRITQDLMQALKSLPRSSPHATEPIDLYLHFREGSSTVTAYYMLRNEDESESTDKYILYERKVALSFPSSRVKGRIPEKRLWISAHEFGHAYAAVRLGQRIKMVLVDSPMEGTGGMVRMESSGGTARGMFSQLFTALGSRAMERIFFSDDPLSEESVMKITTGPSNDIQQATFILWNAMHALGLNPYGGTMERSGGNYAYFSTLPEDKVEKLGLILRELENHLIRDFMAANSMDTYREKISILAREGQMSEEQFYELIGYPYPGRNTHSLSGSSLLHEHFASEIQGLPREVVEAASFRQGLTQSTAQENLDSYLDFFVKTVRKHLPPAGDSRMGVCERIVFGS